LFFLVPVVARRRSFRIPLGVIIDTAIIGFSLYQFSVEE